MNLISDLHLHTVGSEHAYSTVLEVIHHAKSIGLPIIGITDHAPKMKDAPLEYYFINLRVIPKEVDGIRILKGVELNILDETGMIDLQSHILDGLDYAIASFHPGVSSYYYTKEQYTNGYLSISENEHVTILGHIDNPAVDCDLEAVLEKAKITRTLIELNNASYAAIRPGSYERGLELLKLAKKIGTPVIINSDAHFALDVGNFSRSLELVKEADFPEELVINSSKEKLIKYFPYV
jgi:putative hydrolase